MPMTITAVGSGESMVLSRMDIRGAGVVEAEVVKVAGEEAAAAAAAGCGDGLADDCDNSAGMLIFASSGCG